jgi:[ribosomal protein S5]-alanine N-acetyltransferase
VFPEHGMGDSVVLLRSWRPEDAAVKAAWGADALIVRWTGVPAGYTEEQALAYQALIEQSRLAGTALGLAIVESATEAVVGSCDIRRPDPEDPALGEIGYLLAAEARGRGFATRAVSVLVDWALRELTMDRVQALVDPDNPRWAAVLERLGFQREGLLRRYRAGESGREDRVMYALPADARA